MASSVTTSTPPMLDEARELASLMQPTWSAMSIDLRTSGVPLCEGEGGGGEGGEGGEGAAAGNGGGEGGEGGGKESGTGGEEPTITPEEEAIIAKADDPEAVRNLIKAEREARKTADQTAAAATAKAKEYEDAQKSDQEKLAEENADLKSKATEAEGKALRLKVALEKKLPVELIDRLQGSTEEELKADADALLKLVKTEEPGSGTSLDGGARSPAPADVQPGLGRLAHAYAQNK